MKKPNSAETIIKSLLHLVLLLAMIGCDGGLFGTGDGGDVVLPTDASAPGTDGNSGATDVAAPNEPAAPPVPPDGADNSTFDREFQNLLITGNNELPLITLINTSSQSLNMIYSNSVTPLLNAALEPGSISKHVVLLQNQNSVSIINSDNSQLLFRFSSLDVRPSTVTTLIAYDAQVPNTSLNTSSEPVLDVIALRTLTSSSDPSVATIRLIQANQLGTSDSPETMTLVPDGSNPGSGEVIFESVSLSTAPNSSYMSVNAGTYQLQDSLGRFEPVSLSITAATVYSLIITGSMNPMLIIAEDSDVMIQTNTN